MVIHQVLVKTGQSASGRSRLSWTIATVEAVQEPLVPAAPPYARPRPTSTANMQVGITTMLCYRHFVHVVCCKLVQACSRTSTRFCICCAACISALASRASSSSTLWPASEHEGTTSKLQRFTPESQGHDLALTVLVQASLLDSFQPLYSSTLAIRCVCQHLPFSKGILSSC